MKYHAYNKFELIASDSVEVLALAPRNGLLIGSSTVRVPANGANRVQFLAMPLDIFNGLNWDDAPGGVNALLAIAARVNGFPLLPTVLDAVKPLKMQLEGTSFFNVPVVGDRLDFNNAHPAVEDHTVYELTFPDPAGQTLGGLISVMVIRTFQALVP